MKCVLAIIPALTFIQGCAVLWPPSQDYAKLPESAAVRPLGVLFGESPTIANVDAGLMWVNSGVSIKKGQSAQMIAQGTWSDAGKAFGPDGDRYQGMPCPEDARFPYMALLGRIGDGRPFLVGSGCEIVALLDGMLLFTHNDSHLGAWNDAGSLQVQIRVAGTTPLGTAALTCDLRIIAVADGSGIANASGEAAINRLDVLAKGLAGKLKEGIVVKGESVAVVSLRNRSGTSQGKIVADELADKVQGAMIDTGWFDVKERIDLRAILDEKDLDTAGIVKNEGVRKKLAGVKYIIIGGVTVSDSK